jgi:hypothetical protein
MVLTANMIYPPFRDIKNKKSSASGNLYKHNYHPCPEVFARCCGSSANNIDSLETHPFCDVLHNINLIFSTRSQKQAKPINGLETDTKSDLEPSLRPQKRRFSWTLLEIQGKSAISGQNGQSTGKSTALFVDKKQIKEKK